MAFHHCVMFRWTDAVDDAHITKLGAWLDSLPATIDTIRRYAHGSNAGINPGTYDYAVVAEFDDVDGYITYRDHPYHQQMIRELVADFTAERAATQFAD